MEKNCDESITKCQQAGCGSERGSGTHLHYQKRARNKLPICGPVVSEISLLDPGGGTVGSQGHFAPGRNSTPTTPSSAPDGLGGKGCPVLEPGAAKPPLAMYLRPPGANTGQDHIQTGKLFPSRCLVAGRELPGQTPNDVGQPPSAVTAWNSRGRLFYI